MREIAIHVSADGPEGPESQKLTLQAAMSCLLWLLGTESSIRTAQTLRHRAISPVP